MKTTGYIVLAIAIVLFGCDDDSQKENNINSANNTTMTNNVNNTSTTNQTSGGGFEAEDYSELFPPAYMAKTVNWYPCPLVDGDGSSSATADCADVSVPIHWDDPSVGETTVRIKRLAGTRSPRRRIFLLQGGPGGSSTIDFPPSMMEMHLNDLTLDIIAFDHRGTGYSDYMMCPDEMETSSEAGVYVTGEELFSCATSEIEPNFERYSGFTITNAAMDVGYVAELLKEEETDTFVYGVSYGSTWGHRYAQLFPNQSRSVILDSLCVPGLCFLDDYDKNASVVAEQVLDLCKDDPFCQGKMGPDPLARARAVLGLMEGGHCSGAGSKSTIQLLVFMVGQMWEARTMIPALFYRLERCEEEDIRVIQNMAQVLFGQGKKADVEIPLGLRSFNQALFANIAMSELLTSPGYELDAVTERNDGLLASKGLDVLASRLRHVWPLYELDDTYGALSTDQTTMLLINGTLDFQTPIEVAQPIGEALEGDNRRFVVIPDANHGALWASPVNTPGKPACGLQIFFAHLDNPEGPLELTCLDDLKPVDFHGDSTYVAHFMGTSDMWENTQKAPQPISIKQRKEITITLQRLSGF